MKPHKMQIGLIGHGNVGSGVVKFLDKRKGYFKDRYNLEFGLAAICDRRFADPAAVEAANLPKSIALTANADDLFRNPEIHTIVELIGGTHPARELALKALKHGKHFVTANKDLIANYGQELFAEARQHGCHVGFESSVMAGVPIIRTLSAGIAGNTSRGVYGIVNGTCNYILTEMTRQNWTFEQALAEAQKRGFAEPDPSKDINGIDSAHKLAILISLGIGRFIKVKDIHTEGITQISHDDIAHAERLDLCIKLLAIAKLNGNAIEAHVHPTLISKNHPLAAINGINNAVSVDLDPLGEIMLSGEGAGQMPAASGVISDLVNLGRLCMASGTSSAAKETFVPALENLDYDNTKLQITHIDEISTKFYLRIMANDKPGVLAQIAGILGDHGIGINSVTQRTHNTASTVPVIMLTEKVQEGKVRQALEMIHKLPVVKSKPVAIRMEKL